MDQWGLYYYYHMGNTGLVGVNFGNIWGLFRGYLGITCELLGDYLGMTWGLLRVISEILGDYQVTTVDRTGMNS